VGRAAANQRRGGRVSEPERPTRVARALPGMGLHSSTFQLNLGRF